MAELSLGDAGVLDRALRALPSSMQVFDATGRTVFVNDAWRALWNVDDSILSWYNVLQDPLLEANGLLPVLRRAFAGEAVDLPPILYDPKHVGRPGRARYVSAQAYPLLDDAKRVTHVVIAHRELDPVPDAPLLQEATLRQRLLDALSEAGEGVVVAADGRFTYANAPFCELVGYTVDELLAIPFATVFPRDDAPRPLGATPQTERRVMKLRASDGRSIPVDVARKVLESSGRSILIVRSLVAHEEALASLEAANRALSKSERRFRSLATASTDMIWTTGPDGMIEDMPEWRHFTGQTREEVRGEGWLAAVHAEDQARVRETWWIAAKGLRAYACDYRVRARDGSYGQFTARGVPVLSPGGELEGWVGTWTNTTAQHALARRLDEQRELYETLLKAESDLGQGVLLLDGDDRIVYANGACCDLTGYALEELLAPTFRLGQLHTPRTTAVVEARRLTEAAGGGLPPSVEMEIMRKDGDVRWVELVSTTVPLKGHDRRLAILRDVTARKEEQEQIMQLRSQLATTEKLSALGSLVGGVAHEVRTPLTYLLNNLAILETALGRVYPELPPERAARLRERLDPSIHEARESVERINRLVEDLRKFTRLKPQPVATRASLDELVREAVELFRATHRGEVVVKAELSGTPPIAADRVQLQQVVLNLLQNAMEAQPSDATVHVRVRGEGAAAVLEVEDAGVGIPPEVLLRMWDPFYTTKASGTGLGLSIVKRILDEHHARVEVKSETGNGTRFRIDFPVA